MNNEMHFRSIQIDEVTRNSVDEDSRTVEIGVSSETSVDGIIMSHRSEHMDLGFFRSGSAPLLLEHDRNKQIGHIQSVDLREDTGQLRAVVRFGQSPIATEIWQDVVDGVRRNISVGFLVTGEVERAESDPDEAVRVSTQILEASIVSIPADRSSLVGVGRSGVLETQTPEEEDKMTDVSQTEEMEVERTVPAEVKTSAAPAVSEEQIQRNIAAKNQSIMELATSHNRADLGYKAVQQNRSLAEFQSALLDELRNEPVQDNSVVEMSQREEQGYSLMRAIKSAERNHGRPDGFEGEINEELERRHGHEARGFFIPGNLMMRNSSNLSFLNDSNLATNSLKGTDHLGGSYIDLLRANMVIGQAGATYLTGLRGNVQIPKMTKGTGVDWVAENGTPTEDDPEFGLVQLSPKTAAQTVTLSRRMLLQSDPSVDTLVMQDIVQSMARAIDKAALAGDGTNQPSGLSKSITAHTVSDNILGTNPGAASTVQWDHLVDCATAIESANADVESMAWITHPSVTGSLRKTSLQDGGREGAFILKDGAMEILGYRMLTTTQMPTDLWSSTEPGGTAWTINKGAAIFFGNYADMLIGMWSGADLMVNPYLDGKSGKLNIHIFQDVDVAFRRKESFHKITGIDIGSSEAAVAANTKTQSEWTQAGITWPAGTTYRS